MLVDFLENCIVLSGERYFPLSTQFPFVFGQVRLLEERLVMSEGNVVSFDDFSLPVVKVMFL